MDNQQQHQESMNDTVYSEDSFVEEQMERGEHVASEDGAAQAAGMTREQSVETPTQQTIPADDDLLRSYFSPISVTDGSQQENSEGAPVMETITQAAAAAPPRKNSSDGMMASDSSLPNIPPAHPFFSPSFYGAEDSDNSDASIVFNRQPLVPSSSKGATHRNRDRISSLDSMGSSSSIRYVPPGGSNQQPSTPPLPVLPYHERRKLSMKRQQQKQQQEQQQQQQQQREWQQLKPPPAPLQEQLQQQQQTEPQSQRNDRAAAPTPPREDRPQQLPYMSPTNDFGFPQHPFHQPPPYPGFPAHPYVGMPMPPPPGQMPMPPPQPGMFPMYPYPPMPYAQQHQPLLQGPYPPSDMAGSMASLSPRAKRVHYRPQQQQTRQQQTFGSSPLPPSGLPPLQSHLRGAQSSSFDSSGGSHGRAQQPPPPPPPPLPPNYALVRSESVGSVSSLGSQAEDEKEPAKKPPPDPRRTDKEKERPKESEKEGFFQKLNPWSPPKPPTVTEFHRKNQAFLKRAGNRQSGNKMDLSPRTMQSLKSLDMPPPSRGTHKRLSSIDDDDWEESEHLAKKPDSKLPPRSDRHADARSKSSSGYDSSSSIVSSSETSEFDGRAVPDERTSLLPPSGISSNEQNDVDQNYGRLSRSQRNRQSSRSSTSSRQRHSSYGAERGTSQRDTVRMDNTTAALLEHQYQMEHNEREHRKKKKRRSRKKRQSAVEENAHDSSSSESSQDYRRWMKKRAKLLEKERRKLITQWREEAREQEEHNRWDKRFGRFVEKEMGSCFDRVIKFLTWFKLFLANLPLTIGAIALSIATLGVVWFKFAEENLDSCEPVHFHSSQCSFPEFPGCFYCRDKHAWMYRFAVNFHYGCSCFAFVLALSVILKLLLARQVVFDELSSPTTASPAGLLCMTIDVVSAGRGFIGQILVSVAASVHLCLVIWFIYMALAYHIMPEPSWFPNTVSIGLSAVKMWLYYPLIGQLLMAISLSLNFFFFPISLIRVALNKKISATVGWMQMSAPNISLYALTIMAQPSFEEEHPDINKFQKVHRQLYLPCMHFLFALAIMGMIASLVSLRVRWHDFRKLPFSPAHAAFCTPTLSHANAVQAYRAAVHSFSDYVPTDLGMVLFVYWVTVLAFGTIVTLVVASKFLYNLPAWTHIDLEDEIEPPAPYETTMTLSNMISTGETLVQPFVSPAVLQANETGALVLTRNARGQQRLVRTRKVTALGFEPIMGVVEMERERDVLLDWVGKNPPRRRHRTLSVPGIDFNYGADIGSGSGVYGGVDSSSPAWLRRPRSNTLSPLGRSRSRRSDSS